MNNDAFESSHDWLEDPFHFPSLGVSGGSSNTHFQVGCCSKDSKKDKGKKKKVLLYLLWFSGYLGSPANFPSTICGRSQLMEKASLPKKEYALFLALAVVLPVAVATFHCVQMPLWKRQWRIMRRKRKPLQALKTEERKVDPKEFESVPQILGKKGNEGIFIQLGSKDKKKECVGKKQKAEKSYEFDKQDFSTSRGGSSCNHPQRSLEAPPTEYPSYFTLGGRGSGGSSSNDSQSTIAAPQAEDPSPSTEDPSPPAEDPSPPTDDPLPPALGGN